AVHRAYGAQARAGDSPALTRLAHVLLRHPERGAPPRFRRCTCHCAAVPRAAEPARRPRGDALARAPGIADPASTPAQAARESALDHGARPVSGPLVRTRQLGDFRIHALDAGSQKLDGGAMFGVVPKPLWEKRIPADD